MVEERWYFDSGCSHHMTENKCILIDLQPSSLDNVIFEDGAKGKVVVMGSLIIPRLSKIKDVMLVERLTINLISIS